MWDWQNDTLPGELLFGGIDQALLTSAMAWHPPGPSSASYWTVVVERIEVGGVETWSCTEGSSNCWEAMVDSGSSHLSLPDGVVPDVEVFAAEWDCGGVEDLPSLSLFIRTVSGELRNYTMLGKEYTMLQQSSNQTHCTSGIAAAPGRYVTGKALSNMVILGNTFIRKFYTAFDFGPPPSNGRVGFAISKQEWMPPQAPSPSPAAPVNETDVLNITLTEDDVLFSDDDSASVLQQALDGTAETLSNSSVTISNGSSNATIFDALNGTVVAGNLDANGTVVSGDLNATTLSGDLNTSAVHT